MAFFNTTIDADGVVTQASPAAFVPSEADNAPLVVVNRSMATVNITLTGGNAEVTFDNATAKLMPGEFHFALVSNSSDTTDHTLSLAVSTTHGTSVHNGQLITTIL